LAWCRAVLTFDQHGSIALALQSRGSMQLGLLRLVATPIARVAFVQQRERTYVSVTLIVLAVLLYSLVAG
jgi:uncharacterized membrane protein